MTLPAETNIISLVDRAMILAGTFPVRRRRDNFDNNAQRTRLRKRTLPSSRPYIKSKSAFQMISLYILHLLILHPPTSTKAWIAQPWHRQQQHASTQLRESLLSSSSSPRSNNRLDGLSKFHQSILQRTTSRQRFVTGRYPLTVTLKNNPTRKWLGGTAAETEILVNGTTPMRSLASLDRFLWIDDVQERSSLSKQL